MSICRVADHIDDNAAFAFLHRCIEGAAHIDVTEHFKIPGFAPGRLVNIEQRATRNGSGIVHQDINVRIVASELVDIRTVR